MLLTAPSLCGIDQAALGTAEPLRFLVIFVGLRRLPLTGWPSWPSGLRGRQTTIVLLWRTEGGKVGEWRPSGAALCILALRGRPNIWYRSPTYGIRASPLGQSLPFGGLWGI